MNDAYNVGSIAWDSSGKRIVMFHLRKLFGSCSTEEKGDAVPQRRDDRVLARQVVMRRARGNVRLTWGQYLTREDLEERRRKVLAIDFGK